MFANPRCIIGGSSAINMHEIIQTVKESVGPSTPLTLADFDAFERGLVQSFPAADFKTADRFTPGLYIREIFMPKGTVFTSKIHKTEHPFVISLGAVAVLTPDGVWNRLRAPYTGITQPGTKRIILIEEDTIWTTFHVTNKTEVSEIEKDVIEFHENPLLPDAERIAFMEGTK